MQVLLLCSTKEVGKKGLRCAGPPALPANAVRGQKGRRTALRRRNEDEHCEDFGRCSQRREFIRGLNPVLSGASLDASWRSLQRLWRVEANSVARATITSPPIIVSPLINPDRPNFVCVSLDGSVCKYIQTQNLCEADGIAFEAPGVT